MGGVGGGGIFVPMLTLIVGFDTKSAAAISKCNHSLSPLLLQKLLYILILLLDELDDLLSNN